jgi:hypothetical protein
MLQVNSDAQQDPGEEKKRFSPGGNKKHAPTGTPPPVDNLLIAEKACISDFPMVG